jgi:hypothetical protein
MVSSKALREAASKGSVALLAMLWLIFPSNFLKAAALLSSTLPIAPNAYAAFELQMNIPTSRSIRLKNSLFTP